MKVDFRKTWLFASTVSAATLAMQSQTARVITLSHAAFIYSPTSERFLNPYKRQSTVYQDVEGTFLKLKESRPKEVDVSHISS